MRVHPSRMIQMADMQTDLDTLMFALDRALASFTLWNYSPGNTNARGDGWNEEDLSVYSYDQQTDTGDLPVEVVAYLQLCAPIPKNSRQTNFNEIRCEIKKFYSTFD